MWPVALVARARRGQQPLFTSGPTASRTNPNQRRGMLDALDRLSEFRALRVEDLDLTHVPPGRLRTLARYAALSKAQAIQRMPDERQNATLLAFARVYESVAQDDVVDLLHQLIGPKLLRAGHTGERERLRTLRDLDASALRLRETCLIILDPLYADAELRAATFCVLERLHDGLHRRDVFLNPSERWADPRAKLLQGHAWEATRPSVCRTLGRELSAEREIQALAKQLDWTTRYMDAALNHLRATGAEVKKEDLALSHKHFNMLGRHHFAVPEEVLRGELRPLRMPEEADEELQVA
jgi:hypothetical protein